jgi:molybdenum cofactor synthesis domain-containing protein
MEVAVITVGDELLTGDTENTNATWLCRELTERGVDVRRVTVLPDVVDEIADVVAEYHAAYDAVLVTGGLGPTHDDLTMEGVAAAFDRGVEPHPGAVAWLTEEGGYAADDLASGTTELPEDARFLPNEVGVAPGAVVESTYVFPGVPAEMKAMFEHVAAEFAGQRRYRATVHAAEPESELVDRIAAVLEEFDVTVGSYPGDGVDIRITAFDESEVLAAAAWLRENVETDEE